MNVKYLTLAALVATCMSGAAFGEIIFPEKGGIITKSSGKTYKLAVRYRDNETKVATATLVEVTKGSKLTPSLGAQYKFNVEGCGNLDFLQPVGNLPAVLQYDDEFAASQEADCPIYFGAMENSWIIK
ncbi:hypothetical protein [Pseudomonas silensiensis]|uniref:hypothetical protein n=1 Tax=Pseudomonas silensiensis TaxID=2991049 RepID=UPI003D2266B1